MGVVFSYVIVGKNKWLFFVIRSLVIGEFGGFLVDFKEEMRNMYLVFWIVLFFIFLFGLGYVVFVVK